MGTKRMTRKEQLQSVEVPSGTQTNSTLYTTGDKTRETFVGLNGNFEIVPDGTVGGAIAIAIHHKREDSSDITLSVTNETELADKLPDVLWSYLAFFDADVDQANYFPVKIKSMRKLKQGDSLMLSTLGSASGIGSVRLLANMFIKEA